MVGFRKVWTMFGVPGVTSESQSLHVRSAASPNLDKSGSSARYAYTDESIVEARAAPDELFNHLDDQSRLGARMDKGSMMMMGGRMSYEFDEQKGRAVGSVIKMGGSILGIPLFVEEVVTKHDPPRCKVWETLGRPRILIIGAYRMGFEILPAGAGSTLRVFIEYDYPASLTGRVLGAIFAPTYARWCVRNMAGDARRHFR